MISHHPQLGVKFLDLLTRDLQDFGHLLPASHETCGDPIHPKRHRNRFWLDLPFKAHPTTKSLDGDFNQSTLFFGWSYTHDLGKHIRTRQAGLLDALALAMRSHLSSLPLQRRGCSVLHGLCSGEGHGRAQRVEEVDHGVRSGEWLK